MSNTLIFLFTQILKTTYAHITYYKYYINLKKIGFNCKCEHIEQNLTKYVIPQALRSRYVLACD